MKASLVVVSVALQSVAVTALPVALAGELLSVRDIDARSPANPFAAAAQAFGGGNKEDVQTAASSFAGDVAIVSSSLNGMGTTTDTKQIKSMAKAAFVAEKDEDQHRAVLDDAAGRDATKANQKIVDNTPIVLDGLQSIMQNPTMANTMKQLSKVESARNANILPSITQLSNSAFQNTGVDQQAKKFDPTTGTQSLKTLMASGGGGAATGAATNANAGTGTAATGKGAGTAATGKGAGTATGGTAAKGSAAASTNAGAAKGSTAAAGNAGAAKGSAAAAGKGTGKAGAAAAGNTAAGKGSAAAADADTTTAAAAGTGNTAAAKGTGNTAAKGTGNTAAAKGAAGNTAAGKGGAAAADADTTAATAGTGNTAAKGAGNTAAKGTGATTAATGAKGAAAAGKGKTNGAADAAADEDEEEDN
ncbi:hypothetical protein Daus18300_014063 [Diaporthe australafricana]|uniref:Ppe family protein n=1 Tax=Diaporthe australafricana TaxID=127596 RepID=A0ABR3VWN4_9PEZI